MTTGVTVSLFADDEGLEASPEHLVNMATQPLAARMRPQQLADFIGLDVCVSILDVLYSGLGDPKYRACPLLRRMVAAGQLGKKSGRGFYDYRK